jgi:hypothetical protein
MQDGPRNAGQCVTGTRQGTIQVNLLLLALLDIDHALAACVERSGHLGPGDDVPITA